MSVGHTRGATSPTEIDVAIGAIGQWRELVTPRRGASIVLAALALSVVFPSLFKLLSRGRPAERGA